MNYVFLKYIIRMEGESLFDSELKHVNWLLTRFTDKPHDNHKSSMNRERETSCFVKSKIQLSTGV